MSEWARGPSLLDPDPALGEVLKDDDSTGKGDAGGEPRLFETGVLEGERSSGHRAGRSRVIFPGDDRFTRSNIVLHGELGPL